MEYLRISQYKANTAEVTWFSPYLCINLKYNVTLEQVDETHITRIVDNEKVNFTLTAPTCTTFRVTVTPIWNDILQTDISEEGYVRE